MKWKRICTDSLRTDMFKCLKWLSFDYRNVTTMPINLILISNSLNLQMSRILSLNLWDVSFLFSIFDVSIFSDSSNNSYRSYM